MTKLIIPSLHEDDNARAAKKFIELFRMKNNRPKYIFGRNVYAKELLKVANIDGFVDDYSTDDIYLNYPVISTDHLPKDALVIIASGGQPLTAKRKVQNHGFECLDYFSFLKWSGLPLKEIVFNEGFKEDFYSNTEQYEWIFDKLEDHLSKYMFKKLINFRCTYCIDFLKGFEAIEYKQYFEEFLGIERDNEVFVDIGGYDGETSIEFIKRYPGYEAIYLFEPEPGNYSTCVAKLKKYKNTYCYPVCISSSQTKIKFDSDGSASRICDTGDLVVRAERLDSIINTKASYIKMDIEGAELDAIAGSNESIFNSHPVLAMSVYHKAGDFWRIPKKILSIRNDYKVYLRHYTESIYETIMYFVPI